MNFSTVLILVCGLLSGSLAACPPFTSVSNLRLVDQMGDWGVHGVVLNQGTLPSLQCFHVGFSGTQFTKEPVNIDAATQWTYVDTGSSVSGNYPVTVSNLGRPGKWQVNVNGTTYDMSVLHTDYLEYSLMALCHAASGDLKVLLSARSHDQMPVEIANNYLQLLQSSYNIDTTNYNTITHGHACHM